MGKVEVSSAIRDLALSRSHPKQEKNKTAPRPATKTAITHHLPVMPGLPHRQQHELPLRSDVRVPTAVEAGPLGLHPRTDNSQHHTRKRQSKRKERAIITIGSAVVHRGSNKCPCVDCGRTCPSRASAQATFNILRARENKGKKRAIIVRGLAVIHRGLHKCRCADRGRTRSPWAIIPQGLKNMTRGEKGRRCREG